MTHMNPTENDTLADERRIDTTLSLRDALCGKLNPNRDMGHRRSPANQNNGRINKTSGFPCVICARGFKSKHELGARQK